jgi:hypothetical protein
MSNQVATMSFDMTDPFPMKIEEMGFKELNFFVGQNGAGKSFLLKQNFLMSYAIAGYYLSLDQGIPTKIEDLLNFALQNTFSEPDFNGTIEASYTNGIRLSYTMENGVVKEALLVENGKEITSADVPFVKFLSAEMRTFDDISRYLKLRKRVSGVEGIPNMEELLKDYRLYDVLYLEGLINTCPIKFTDAAFANFDFPEEKTPVWLEVDLDKTDFYVTYKDGAKEATTRLGKGHQSLINMIAANS